MVALEALAVSLAAAPGDKRSAETFVATRVETPDPMEEDASKLKPVTVGDSTGDADVNPEPRRGLFLNDPLCECDPGVPPKPPPFSEGDEDSTWKPRAAGGDTVLCRLGLAAKPPRASIPSVTVGELPSIIPAQKASVRVLLGQHEAQSRKNCI